jgi:hypothetical protein
MSILWWRKKKEAEVKAAKESKMNIDLLLELQEVMFYEMLESRGWLTTNYKHSEAIGQELERIIKSHMEMMRLTRTVRIELLYPGTY